MGVVDGQGDGFHDPGAGARVGARPADLLGKGAPRVELHAEVGPAPVLSDFVDRDDMGMVQAGDGLGFPAEAVQLLRRGGVAGAASS